MGLRSIKRLLSTAPAEVMCAQIGRPADANKYSEIDLHSHYLRGRCDQDIGVAGVQGGAGLQTANAASLL
jgi:hypothetical protein